MISFVRVAVIPMLLTAVSLAQSFSTPQTVDTPRPPQGVIVTDVNHDGFADVLIPSASFSDVSVMLNDGKGNLHIAGVYDIGGDLFGGVVVADFNGDGKLDIAVGNQGTSSINILFGNGDGTFQSPQVNPVSQTPSSLVVGDFNNDGKMDLAFLSGNTITILTNTGSSFTSSSFTIPQYWSEKFGSSDALRDLTAGDFNGDGRIDLAYVDSCVPVNKSSGASYCGPNSNLGPSDNYYVLMNTASGWKPYPVFSGSSKYIVGTMSLHAIDVDNDGKADLVGTYWYGYSDFPTPSSLPCFSCSHGAEVLYSNGNGEFQQVRINFEGSSLEPPDDIVVADMNNDGINDLVCELAWGSGTQSFVVLDGKGGRSGFKAPVLINSTEKYLVGEGIGVGFLRAQTRKDVILALDLDELQEFRNTASVAAEPCQYPVIPAIHYCGPANGSSVKGPGVNFQATTRPAGGSVRLFELWVDGKKLFQTTNDRMNHTQTLSKGKHAATVVEVDTASGIMKSNVVTFTVK